MNFTLTQQTIIEEIEHIVDTYPQLTEQLSELIPEELDSYESWTSELWNKVDEFLLNNYRS
jgi:hypothetical protein